jgi:hypothetical protein
MDRDTSLWCGFVIAESGSAVLDMAAIFPLKRRKMMDAVLVHVQGSSNSYSILGMISTSPSNPIMESREPLDCSRPPPPQKKPTRIFVLGCGRGTNNVVTNLH